MQPKRLLIGLFLIFSITACSIVPSLPDSVPVPNLLATEGPTPTPTPRPTYTPSPTPVPLVRLGDADRALFDGDYDSARSQYQIAYKESNDPEVLAAALLGLGRTEYAAGNYDAALSNLQELIGSYPDSPFVAYAQFALGQTYAATDRNQEAAQAWKSYLDLRPGWIDGYVQEMRGDALSAAGSYTEALDAYNAALAIDRLDDGLDIDIKIAKTYAAFGDYANALTRYDDISSRTGNDYIKSQMDYLAGYAYVTIGQTNEGYQRYQHTVENYPLSYYSYLALLELVAANVDVNDFNRGLVDYYAGQYDVALAAFDRYLASGAADDGTAHYYRAQTLWALDRPADALSEFNLFISKYPDNDKWSNAWGDKADLLWQDMNNFPDAAQTLLDFVAAVPTHEDADNFLFDAGRIYERDNRLDQAAAAWEQLADSYPGSELATEALFQAGIVSYRSNDFNRAQTDFQRGLLLTVESKDQARSYLWVGKTQQKLGDTSAAQKAWQQAQSLDPTGYYSERAKDLLMGQAPFTDPPSYNLDIDMQAERREAASWLRLTFNLPADTNLDGPGPLLQDARMVRGTELWELGLYDQARLEFESLRKDVNMDAANSFRLANYLLDLGLYRSAIAASNQVLSLAGQDLQNSTLQAPDYFKHVRYGLYYKDLIVPAAQKNNFSPLFLFSVIWQESQFEGFVRSTAGAHGLMQIIPSTGANLAIQLAWPLDFKPEDLYRPNVSIELGSYYLASNRDLLDGNLYAALAAYNAGPGNAVIWDKLAGDDPDLLLEIIRYDETRQYIRYIYEVYTIYKTLYGPGI